MKITEELKATMRQQRAQGMKYTEIAEANQVSLSTAYKFTRCFNGDAKRGDPNGSESNGYKRELEIIHQKRRNYQAFSGFLEKEVEMRGRTYLKVSKRSGITKQVLSNYRKGKNIPTRENLRKLLKALNPKRVHLEELLIEILPKS